MTLNIKFINTLKEQGEDFELYPTTDEILDVVTDDIKTQYMSQTRIEVLDIGAGNGKFLYTL